MVDILYSKSGFGGVALVAIEVQVWFAALRYIKNI